MSSRATIYQPPVCVHTQRADDPAKEVTGASRDVQGYLLYAVSSTSSSMGGGGGTPSEW